MPRDEYICTVSSTSASAATLTPDVDQTVKTVDIDTFTIAGARVTSLYRDDQKVRVIIEY